MADLHVFNTGSIVILTPISEAGHQWLDHNLAGKITRYGECSVAVEPRYVGAIVDGAIKDGLDLS